MQYLALEHRHIEHHEVDARKKLEEYAEIFDERRVEMQQRVVVWRKTACGSGCHGIVHTVVPSHSRHLKRYDAGYGQHCVDAPYPFCAGTKPRMEFRLYRTGCFCGKHLHTSSHYRWEYGYGEKHYSETAYPLCHRPPEEYAVRHVLHVVEYRRTGGGKSRHGLEVSVGKIGDIASYEIWKHSEHTEYQPRGRHHEICVATAETVVGIASEISEYQSSCNGDECRDEKRQHVVFSIKERRAETSYHHERLDIQQLSEYLR